MTHFSPKQLKIAGLIVLLIPMVILAVFTVGETAGGDISGLQHVVQALLFLPAVIAGVLLIASAKVQQGASHEKHV